MSSGQGDGNTQSPQEEQAERPMAGYMEGEGHDIMHVAAGKIQVTKFKCSPHER